MKIKKKYQSNIYHCERYFSISDPVKFSIINSKKIGLIASIIFVVSFFCVQIHADDVDEQSGKLKKNSINLYVGSVYMDVNLNYERNIFQLPKSYTNIRMGIGRANFSEFRVLAYYLNPSIVHLIGRKNLHLELNLGFKYPISELPETISRVLVPDLFAGLRYEKPDGWFIFRMGINYPSVFDIGMGLKF
jgi:hypothetical protein